MGRGSLLAISNKSVDLLDTLKVLKIERDKQGTCNVTFRRVRVIIVASEEQ